MCAGPEKVGLAVPRAVPEGHGGVGLGEAVPSQPEALGEAEAEWQWEVEGVGVGAAPEGVMVAVALAAALALPAAGEAEARGLREELPLPVTAALLLPPGWLPETVPLGLPLVVVERVLLTVALGQWLLLPVAQPEPEGALEADAWLPVA